MPISSKVKNRIMDAINTRLSNIGSDAETALPRSKNNRDAIAWEYYVANHVVTMANARAKAAEKEAIRAGVIFDPSKEPKREGTNEATFLGDNMSVIVSVYTGSSHLDKEALKKYLIEHKVKRELVDDAILLSTKQHRPTHRFVASVLTSDVVGK